LADRIGETAREALFRLVGGYRLTQALYVTAKLGIADRLSAGPKDANTLAQEVGVHSDRLFRVLRSLASHGVFTLDEERRFGLTPVGEYLRTDAPGSLAPLAIFSGEEPYRAFGELLYTVRTGETAFDHLYGMGHFEYLAQHPEASATFHRTMVGTIGALGGLLEGFDFRNHHVLVDVGGGQGALLVAVLQGHTGLRGVLFDVPEAVLDAPALLESSGVKNRCQIRTGSAFEFIPPGGDVYLMSRVLHDWPDEKALVLLRNCRKVLPHDGVLLVREAVLAEGSLPPALAQRDLIMMAMTGGRERTEDEWRGLLREAGFVVRRIWTNRAGLDLIEAGPD
jgi:SAM-dependent methyltransferase